MGMLRCWIWCLFPFILVRNGDCKRDEEMYSMIKRVRRAAFTALKIGCIVFFLVCFAGVVLVEAASTSLSITPVSQTVSAGTMVNISVEGVPQQPVKAFELKVAFNPSILQATAVSEGDFFGSYTTFFNQGVIDNVAGTIVNVYDLIVGPGNVSNPGVLVLINFTAKSTNGVSTLRLYDVRLTNETNYISVSVSSASVTVTGGSSPPPSEPPVTPPPSSPNQPPSTPLKPSGPVSIQVGTSYEYTDAAIDPDGDQVRLRFDWGDGSLSNWTGFVGSNTSVTVSHAWGNVSTSVIRVIAQDAAGLNSSWSDPLNVTVSQAGSAGSPPVGVFLLSQNASSNHTIVFNASGIYDPDGVIVSYQWDFGDGVTAVGEHPVHTYQSPGQYTVTLTVTDNTGLTLISSQVISIAAGSVVPTKNETNFFQSNSSVIFLLIVLVPVLVVLLVFRDKIHALYLQRHIEASHLRLAQFPGDTAEIDSIVDALFANIKNKSLIPNKISIMDAYNDFVLGKIETNAAFRPPDLSIDEIEKLVDRRIQSKIEETVDKM
jgi:hypothetical protein